jgi:hypothetical protein
MMDRVLQPHQYEWWYEKMEEENQLRIEMGKKPKKQKKYNAAIEAYRYVEYNLLYLFLQ